MRTSWLARVFLAPVLILAAGGLLSAVAASAVSAAPQSGFGSTFGNGVSGIGSHGSAGNSSGSTYTCAGGTIPAGTYGSMVITGVCYMSAGNISIQGDLTVAPGALLDAATQGDPAGSPVVPATVVVGSNVYVDQG